MATRSWIWVGSLLATAAQAATLTLTPVKDNTLYENSSGALSNGKGKYLFAGKTNGGSVRRALLAFDLSSVPANAQLTRVALTLTLSKTISGAQTHTLHRVLADWGEGSSDAGDPGGRGTTAATGDATWLHTFASTSFWTTPGGDYSDTQSASQGVSRSSTYTWESAQMLAEVQAWIASPATNFGWILLGNESANGTAKRFNSLESSTAAQRPKLTVEYTLPNTPPTAGSLPDLYLALSGGSAAIDPAAAPALFSDADSDPLSYTALSTDTSKVSVLLMENTLFVTPKAPGTATITLSAEDGRGGSVSLSFAVQVNNPPTLAAIPDQILDEDHASGIIALELGDAETAADSLTLSARSDNSVLLPSSGMALGGSGASRTLKLTPAADQSGSATLTLTVSDGSDSTTLTFALKVNPIDDPPVVTTPIPSQTLALDQAGLFSIDLSAPAVFADPEGDTLSYAASSSDTAVVAVTLSGQVLFLVPRAAGSASLTLSADDGKGGEASTTFSVAVTAPALQLTGDFDGDLNVGFADFFLFADHFGETSSSQGWNPLFDLAANGTIDFEDFFVFADHFGEKAAP
ncbi:MAG: DNRLRE domain-containing protein [Candidatus Latescibacteria bacterium]|nr:DNRLRE domain-containing protein [Candidatus Latescibacterota bacterium]